MQSFAEMSYDVNKVLHLIFFFLFPFPLKKISGKFVHTSKNHDLLKNSETRRAITIKSQKTQMSKTSFFL